MLPVIILVGIYTGIFAPTEAAAVMVVYVVLMGFLRGRIRSARLLNRMIYESTGNGSMILMVIVGAMQLGAFFTNMQLPQVFAEAATKAALDPWMVLVLTLIILTIMGMFLEVASVMLITVPVFYPVLISFGYDGIWLGVIYTLVMGLGLLTPPVGMNLYVAMNLLKSQQVVLPKGSSIMDTVSRGALPFLLLITAAIVLVWIFPYLALWLPSTMR